MLAGIRLPDSWLAAPITLWRFSRPHTLVGTTTSILGIYAIAAAELPGVALGDGVAEYLVDAVEVDLQRAGDV